MRAPRRRRAPLGRFYLPRGPAGSGSGSLPRRRLPRAPQCRRCWRPGAAAGPAAAALPSARRALRAAPSPPPAPRLAANFAPRRLPPAGSPCEQVARTAAEAAAAAAGTERGAAPPPSATGAEPAQTGSDREIPSRLSLRPMAPRSVWKPRASAQRPLPLVPRRAAAPAASALIGRHGCPSGAEPRRGGGSEREGGKERGASRCTLSGRAELSLNAGPASSSQTAGAGTGT